MKCKFCGRESKNKNSHINHERLCKSNPDRQIKPKTEKWYKAMAEKKGKGANQYTYGAIMSEETRKKIAEKNKGQVWTEERKANHSLSMKKAVLENPDSYSKNNVCGRVKTIEYNGQKLKGKWELKTAQWLDKLGYEWKTEVNPQPYYWNNEWHMYFPDFFLPTEEIYIEVKGYKTERDEAKWSYFKGTLLLVDKNVIENLFELQIKDLAPLA